MLDLIVDGGTVVDGTGAPRYRADVGVLDGRIEAVGDLAGAEAARRLDAAGLLVTPGFIDIHSHSDFTLLVDPRAQSSIVQGVTTEVVGNCGHGCAPITDPELFKGNIYGYTPLLDIDWSTTAEYFQKLEDARTAVNVAALVPNGNLRLAAAGRLRATLDARRGRPHDPAAGGRARRGRLRVLDRPRVPGRARLLGRGDGRAVPRGRPGRRAVRDPRAQQGGLRGGGRGGGDPGGRGRRGAAAALPHHPAQGWTRRRKGARRRGRREGPRPRRGRRIRRPHDGCTA